MVGSKAGLERTTDKTRESSCEKQQKKTTKVGVLESKLKEKKYIL